MGSRSLLYIVFFLIIISTFKCSSDKKEFTIWIGGAPQEVDFWQSVVDNFQKQSGYNVNLVRQPTYSDQRRQSLVISLEAQQPNPDVFLMDVVWTDQFMKSGWLINLDSLVQMNNFPTDLFFPHILNSVDKLNNKLYALPVFMDVGLLYYRKDLLNKYGYDNHPQTWEELVNQSINILQNENILAGFVWQGAQYEGLTCTFLEYVSSNGGKLMNNGEIDVYSEKNLQALNFMQDLIHKYNISPPNTYTEMKEEEVRRAFQSGNAVFERNWSYAFSLHQGDNSEVKNKFGMTQLPHFKGSSSAATLGGWHIGISEYSDVKKEAWDFIKYVTSFEVQTNMFENMGWFPARSDIYKDEDLLEKHPRLHILFEALNNAVARPSVPYYPQVSEVIQRFVNNCLAAKISPEVALKEMQKEINEITSLYED